MSLTTKLSDKKKKISIILRKNRLLPCNIKSYNVEHCLNYKL
jgi:hypothetical protein